MTTYDLYLESGPKRRKTMVHVPALLGCVANGPTTEEALAATPAAVRTFLRFLARHGDDANPEAAFEPRVAEHVTQGDWLGNGSPYIAFTFDFDPVPDAEAERLLKRFRWMREELAAWAATQTAEQLDTPPEAGGRPARAILLHTIGPTGAYLSAALGGAPGFSRLVTAAERGTTPLPDALRQGAGLAAERVWRATAEERARVQHRPKDVRTFRKALRRMLEHDWEHLAELSRRPGGPPL